MSETTRQVRTVPEWGLIASMTLLAAVLRLAGFGRDGLEHFDEGIYAGAAAWSLRSGGLSTLDPGLIPYAPPGYPILVGVAYRLVGPGDLTPVAVSILSGVATIPLVGWLGRRTFGPPSGVAASALAAVSMAHVTFSRTGLTDPTFLLVWVMALIAGSLFLERPGPGRAVALGLAVGAAQLAKYNGWLAGVIVAATAGLGPFLSDVERDRLHLVRIFGWGLLAAALAAVVYAPWFLFVESHGGYAALLRHHRSYLGTPADWPSHWLIQLRELSAMAGPLARSSTGAVLAAAMVAATSFPKAARPSAVATALVLPGLALAPATSSWWIGLAFAPILLVDRRPWARLIGVWWVVMAALTPLYHPYARLWLPLEAAGWVVAASVLGAIGRPDAEESGSRVGRTRLALLILAGAAGWLFPVATSPHPVPLPSPVGEARDSLRRAAARIVAAVPMGAGPLRVLARPALLVYASGPLAARGVATVRVASPADFEGLADGWALVDSVQLLQEEGGRERLLRRWEVVAEEPTILSNATLLDVDPDAAVGRVGPRSQSLLLLRPRRGGDSR